MKGFESYPVRENQGINWSTIPEINDKPITITGQSGLPITIYFSPPDGSSVVEYLAMTDDNALKIDNPKKSRFVLEAQVVKDKGLNVASFGLYSLSKLASFITHQGSFKPYILESNDRRRSTYPEFPYAQPDFYARQFVLGFIKRCQNRGTTINYIQDLWNRGRSILYDQFMSLFELKTAALENNDLTHDELETIKIQCASQTWSANVYSEAGFHTIKKVTVDLQFNLGAAAQFWP